MSGAVRPIFREIAQDRAQGIRRQSGWQALSRAQRVMLSVLLAWAVLFPAVHYYLGQNDVISGDYGVTPAGIIDFGMFCFALGLLLLRLLAGPARVPYLFAPLMIYFGAVIYSILISPIPTIAVRGEVVAAVPLLVFLDLLILNSHINLSELIGRLAIFSTFVPITIALVQFMAVFVPPLHDMLARLPAPAYTLEPYPGLPIPRVTGSLFTYNNFAIFLGIAFWAAFLRLDNWLTPRWRIVYLALVLLLIGLTFMRAMWLAMIVSGVLVLVLSRSRARLLLLALGVIALIIVVLPPINDLIFQRLGAVSSYEERGGLASFGLQKFLEQPWGYGSGTSHLLTAELDFTQIFTFRGGLEGGYSFHNEYITTAVQGGIFLFLAYLFLVLSLFLLGWRIFKLAPRTSPCFRWGIWLVAATLILTETGFTDAGLTYGSFLFWILVAATEMEFRAFKSARRAKQITAHAQVAP